MTENKKVRNARRQEYDGILFKSGLEVEAYKAFTAEGFGPEYEKHTYELQKTQSFPTPCYTVYSDRKLHKKVWGLNRYKTIGMKYTPDFTFIIGEKLVIVEMKGFANDRYAYQRKLFFKWLENNRPDSVFFEIHNKGQLRKAIEIIKGIRDDNEKF